MGFSQEERLKLLKLKGVGEKVVQRLEELGYASLADLAGENALDVVSRASLLTGSSCWKNSPQARSAISRVIELAGQAKDSDLGGK